MKSNTVLPAYGHDPQDIEATLGWMGRAVMTRDQKALDDLFWKLREQIDALEEEYTDLIDNHAGEPWLSGTIATNRPANRKDASTSRTSLPASASDSLRKGGAK